MLVLDEVYYPFGDITGIDLIKKFLNVLVMRSFSKAFGLAGIRLGYLIGSEEIIVYISKIRTGYVSNSVSIEIASYFMDNFEIILNYVQEVKDGLNYNKNELNLLGIEHNGGEMGNFIFINLKDNNWAKHIIISLRKKNIYVRGEWPAPFDGGFSVTGVPKNVMEKFFNEFKTLFLEKKG